MSAEIQPEFEKHSIVLTADQGKVIGAAFILSNAKKEAAGKELTNTEKFLATFYRQDVQPLTVGNASSYEVLDLVAETVEGFIAGLEVSQALALVDVLPGTTPKSKLALREQIESAKSTVVFLRQEAEVGRFSLEISSL